MRREDVVHVNRDGARGHADAGGGEGLPVDGEFPQIGHWQYLPRAAAPVVPGTAIMCIDAFPSRNGWKASAGNRAIPNLVQVLDPLLADGERIG